MENKELINGGLIKKQQVVSGITWYKVYRNSGINEYLKTLCNEAKKEELWMIKTQTDADNLYAVATAKQIKKLLLKNHYLYETIMPDRKARIYFDCDCYKGEIFKAPPIDEILYEIEKAFPNSNPVVSGNNDGEAKYSYHIVLNGWHTENHEQVLFVKQFASQKFDFNGEMVEFFDNKVYSKFQAFKAVNQQKPGGLVQLQMGGSKKLVDFTVHQNISEKSKCITELGFELTPLSIRENNDERFNFTGFTPTKECLSQIPDGFDLNNSPAIEKLAILPNPPREDKNALSRNQTMSILVWSFQSRISFSNFWQWCKSKDDNPERKEHYAKRYGVDYEYGLSDHYINQLLIKCYPELTLDFDLKRFKKLHEVENTKIVSGKFLSLENIGTEKITFMNVSMGGAKTTTVSKWLNVNKHLKRRLFVCPRISLANSVASEFSSFANYADNKYKGVNFKQLKENNEIIISPQGLWKLIEYGFQDFDVVIVDEVETLLDSFRGECKTQKEHGAENWVKMFDLIKNSKKTFFMDAFLTNTTVNMVKAEFPEASTEIITLSEPPTPRTFKVVEELEVWFNAIIHCLEKGEKCIVFMPYKKTNDKPKTHKHRGVHELTAYICHHFGWVNGIDAIGYHGDAHLEKAGLKNVEENWKRAKCIIGNSSLSVGVNYQGDDYDRVFCYYTEWSNTNDILQFLYRVRKPKNKECLMFMEKVRYSGDVYREINLTPQEFTKSWDILKKDERTTFNSKSKNKLEILSKRANIRFLPEKLSTMEAELITQTKMLDKSFRIEFKDIPDIELIDYNILVNDFQCQNLTLMDNLKIKKFLVRCRIIKNSGDNVAQYFFENYSLFSKLSSIDDEKLIINRIFKGNGADIFDGGDITGMTIPLGISNDDVKKIYNLRTSMGTRKANMVKRLVNGFFGVVVYKQSSERTTISGRKQYRYEGTDDWKKMLDYFKICSIKHKCFIDGVEWSCVENDTVEGNYELVEDEESEIEIE